MTSERIFKAGRKQVIAISGGGYKGLFSANVLAALEEDTGKKISETTDLIVGTSVGGILACGLACGIDASNICLALKLHGREIFPKRAFPKLRRMWSALYCAEVLERVLKDIFQDNAERSITELDCRIVLTVVDEITGKTQYIDSIGYATQRPYTVLEAAMATAAAPTYFRSRAFRDVHLVDGGLGANSPEVVAIETMMARGVDLKDIVMLGVGSAGGSKTKPKKLSRASGGIGWLFRYDLINLMFSAQESVSRNLAKSVLREHYLLVEETPQSRLKLDDASLETTQLLEDLAASAVTEARKASIWKRWGVFNQIGNHPAVPGDFDGLGL